MALKRKYLRQYPNGKIYSARIPKNNPRNPNSGESAAQMFQRRRPKTIAQHEKEQKQREQQRAYQEELNNKRHSAAAEARERLAAASQLIRFNSGK